MQKNNTTKKRKPRREGQIIKRGKSTYLVRVYLYQDAKGKRHYYNATVKGTKKDAEMHLIEYLRKKHQRTLTNKPSNRRFGEFIEDYFLNVSDSKERNRMIDLSKVKLYIIPVLGHLKLKDVSSLHIENFYKELKKRISKKTKKPLSGTTRNHVHRILSKVFTYAIKRRLIMDNPIKRVAVPKVDSKEMNTLSSKQVLNFLKQIDNQKSIHPKALTNHIGCMFHLAIETGLRPEEYLALKWSDIDYGDLKKDIQPTLQVQRVVVRINNRRKFSFDEPKTQSSRRAVTLSSELVERLKKHSEEVSKRKQKVSNWTDYDLVFPNNAGEPNYMNAIRRLFKKTLKNAEIEPSLYRLYDLRHSCASLLLRANVHPKIVSERLGHSSVAITLDVYSHSLPSMQQSATQSIIGMIYE